MNKYNKIKIIANEENHLKNNFYCILINQYKLEIRRKNGKKNAYFVLILMISVFRSINIINEVKFDYLLSVSLRITSYLKDKSIW